MRYDEIVLVRLITLFSPFTPFTPFIHPIRRCKYYGVQNLYIETVDKIYSKVGTGYTRPTQP